MDMKIYGTDRRLPSCRTRLLRLLGDTRGGSLVLLPIPSVKDGIHVTGTDVVCTSLLQKGGILCGYGFPESVRPAAAEAGCLLCDVAGDERFLRDNAALTALGALRYLLTHLKSAPKDWRVGILGYDRIGKELLRLLLFLGASVKVYSGKESTRHALGKCGIPTESTADGTPLDFTRLDVLINTAPTAGFVTRGMPLPPCILELASGENLPGVPHVSLPSLPAKRFPVSAGYAYADAIYRAFLGQ